MEVPDGLKKLGDWAELGIRVNLFEMSLRSP